MPLAASPISYYVPTEVPSVKSRQNEFVKNKSRIPDEPNTVIASIALQKKRKECKISKIQRLHTFGKILFVLSLAQKNCSSFETIYMCGNL